MSDSPILAVFEHYGFTTPYHLRYGWNTVSCPWHGDTRASARINTDIGRFKCLGCDLSLDAIGVVMQQEGMGFLEAKQLTEEIAGTSDLGVRDVSRARSYLPQRKRDHKGARTGVPSRVRRRPAAGA